jgi:PAS domain S-box-containing protein
LDLGFGDNQAATMEHAFMHEVEYLDALCNTADGVFITDENQRIIRWNAGAEKLLGHPETEVLNHLCFQIISGQTASDRTFCNPYCKIHDAGIKGTPQENFDLQVRTAAGSAAWLNITVLSNKDQEKRLIAHILRDVTQEKRKILALDQFLNEIRPHDNESLETIKKTPGHNHSGGIQVSSSNPDSVSLSEREIEVLTIMAEGLSTKALAQRLSISPFTARNHIQNILVKLNIHSKAQAVSYAFKKGIL